MSAIPSSSKLISGTSRKQNCKPPKNGNWSILGFRTNLILPDNPRSLVFIRIGEVSLKGWVWLGQLNQKCGLIDSYSLRPEFWKHPFGIPGVRSMFLKPKFHKKSKNGFKTINFRRYPVMIFSKNSFRSKKIIKKIGCFVDFWIFLAIYMNKLDQF